MHLCTMAFTEIFSCIDTQQGQSNSPLLFNTATITLDLVYSETADLSEKSHIEQV